MRAHRGSFLALCFLIVAACSSCGDRRPPDGPSGTVPVTKVTDGDTIRVIYQGHDERVRLIGVDTPEVPWYGGDEECYGVKAGLYARQRLAGRSVRLVFDAERRDRYGRLLAYLYLGPELFNLTLVRLGYATADPVPPDIRMASRFAAAEAQARSARRGLWSACPQ
jgi:micrococcal nuclease